MNPGESAQMATEICIHFMLKTRGMFVGLNFWTCAISSIFHRICEHCRKKNPKVLNYIYIIENEEISTTGSLQWILWRLRLKTGRISYLYNVMAESFCPFIRAEIDLGFLLVISALDKSTHIKLSTWFSWCKFAVP